MMIKNQRHLFSIPDSHAYLNTAYMSPLMTSVVAAMESGMAEKIAPWNYKSSQFFEDGEIFRSLGAQLLGGDSECIAIVPSASYGLQIAANNLPLSRGQQVLVCEDQFPSHIYPWQDRAAREGAEVVIVPTPNDDDWTAAILARIDPNTAIVAVPQTHWSTGVTLDLAAIRDALDRVGGTLALDLTQSLGAQPIDVDAVRPDFVVAATYKWLLGPYSLGLLYVAPRWHDGQPLEQNWINRKGSEDFTGLTRYEPDYQPGARRYDMGEKSNPAALRGASVALRQILDWGVENIAQTLQSKTQMLEAALAPLGLRAPKASRAPHYLGLRRDGGIPVDLSAKLAADNIYISVRGPALRVTPHLYTTEYDTSRLIDALQTHLP